MKKVFKWLAGFLLGIVLLPLFPFALGGTMKGGDDDE